LTSHARKGFTPKFFSTRPAISIVGAYPEPEFYGAEYMYGDERAQFLERHQGQKGKVFSNHEELLAYCMDDVDVLRQACFAFRNLFLKLVKMDLFREVITISSI
jgi:hypothetical protein